MPAILPRILNNINLQQNATSSGASYDPDSPQSKATNVVVFSILIGVWALVAFVFAVFFTWRLVHKCRYARRKGSDVFAQEEAATQKYLSSLNTPASVSEASAQVRLVYRAPCTPVSGDLVDRRPYAGRINDIPQEGTPAQVVKGRKVLLIKVHKLYPYIFLRTRWKSSSPGSRKRCIQSPSF